jgi:hypothetical protein
MNTIEKLERLALHLEKITPTLQPGQFNLGEFFIASDNDREYLDEFVGMYRRKMTQPFPIVASLQIGDSCGFAGCAMGHACSIPEFRAEGLTIVDGALRYNHPDSQFISNSWNAVQYFFRSIPIHTLEYLFSPGEYDVIDDPLIVAQRCREVAAQLKEKEKNREAIARRQNDEGRSGEVDVSSDDQPEAGRDQVSEQGRSADESDPETDPEPSHPQGPVPRGIRRAGR